MTTSKEFNVNLSDSQATPVNPVSPDRFDFEDFLQHEADLSERCKSFAGTDSGILVHRRMRVAEVFTFGCRDFKRSLEWQLGALEKSIQYRADVPNFLEPWYGIGTVASSFGIDYKWPEGQAPAVDTLFDNVKEALSVDVTPIEDTVIGGQTLNLIDYFLDKTRGLLPLSFCDSQSPLNVASNLVKTDNFLVDLYMNPESVVTLLERIADLMIDFYRKQEQIIGECLVKPGHGFASSRHFRGNGFSDDTILMLEPQLYRSCIEPSFVKSGNAFGGGAFHSCGNWSNFINTVINIPGLITADAAFSMETDPDPNPCKPFADAFAGTGIVLNARIVGDVDTIAEKVAGLWKPGMKLIVVTYCRTPGEQEEAYSRIHNLCKMN